MSVLSHVIVASFWSFLPIEPTSTWLASAGAQPQAPPSVYKDPRPRYYDPPAGRYRLPDGTVQQADPPRGFYDPPAGFYPVPTVEGPATGSVLGPLPTAEGARQAWLNRRHGLRIGLGLSLSVVGLGAIAPLIVRPIWPDHQCVDCFPPGALAALIMVPAGLIATIVFSVRLAVHNRRRPPGFDLRVDSGGLRLAF